MKWRVIGALVALTAIVLLVQDLPLAFYLRSVESNRIITELQRDAFVIAGRSEQVLRSEKNRPTPALTAMLNQYSRGEGASVLVVDSDGKVVAHSGPWINADQDFANQSEIKMAFGGDTSSGERDVDGQSLLYVTVPALSGARTLGAVQITYPTAKLDARVNERVRGIAIVGGLTLLVAVGIAFILASTITRPIRRLQLTTEQLAHGDLTARADTNSGAPELKKLGEDLNAMARQLSNLLEAQRSFASDASHQLRTPLTALRLRLDQAAEELATSPEEAAETIDEARAETERLQHVIDGLLQLARSEGRAGELRVIDLVAEVHERLSIWEPLAEEHSVSLTFSGPQQALILSAPQAAGQILDNYLDNALSVSPSGSTVQIVVSTSVTHITLSVCDEGPGLTPEQRKRAFDRFWSMREDNAGTGLGLAIVRQLAELSGASVELRESASGGIDAIAIFHRDKRAKS